MHTNDLISYWSAGHSFPSQAWVQIPHNATCGINLFWKLTEQIERIKTNTKQCLHKQLIVLLVSRLVPELLTPMSSLNADRCNLAKKPL